MNFVSALIYDKGGKDDEEIRFSPNGVTDGASFGCV